MTFMNPYIQTNSNFATEEAADIKLATAADDSVKVDAAYSASGVSISDDAEGNIKAILGDKKPVVKEAAATAALDDSEGNIKAVLGDKKSDVIESSALAAALWWWMLLPQRLLCLKLLWL
jgi:hypothetical protein